MAEIGGIGEDSGEDRAWIAMRPSPYGVVVSIASVSERKAMPRSPKSVMIDKRCGSERPEPVELPHH